MASNEVSIDLDSFDEFEASAWEERVEGYAGFFGAVTGRLVEPLLELARVGPGTHVLDVATGPGYVAAEAARRGATVWGVDVAEAMVARARAEHPGVESGGRMRRRCRSRMAPSTRWSATSGCPTSAVRSWRSPRAYGSWLPGAVWR